VTDEVRDDVDGYTWSVTIGQRVVGELGRKPCEVGGRPGGLLPTGLKFVGPAVCVALCLFWPNAFDYAFWGVRTSKRTHSEMFAFLF
jgi:hypothetical protein